MKNNDLYNNEPLSVEELADVVMNYAPSYSKEEALKIAQELYFVQNNISTSYQGSIFTRAFELDVY